MVDIDAVLDSEWISNILGIAFTLLIFLLGLPVVFVQSYLPELRKYYVQHLIEQKYLVKKAVWLILPIIILFGNQEIKFIIDKIIFPDGSTILEIYYFCISKTSFSLIYYLISLLYFIYFSFKIIGYFEIAVFGIEDIKATILKAVFDKIKTSKDTGIFVEKGERETLIETLIDLSTIYNSPHDRNSYLEKLFYLIRFRIDAQEYKGYEIRDIYSNVLSDIFLKNFHNCSTNNFRDLLLITNAIASKYSKTTNLGSFDSEYISQEFLKDLTYKFIDNNEINWAIKYIAVIKSFDFKKQDILFKILSYAFQKRLFELVTIQIRYLIKDLIKKKKSADDDNEIKNKLIAYLALYHHENEVMKSYAKDTLNTLKEYSCKLQITDFEQAKEDFTDNSKFDTANKIQLMMKDYFPQTQSSEKPKRVNKERDSSK